MAFADFNNDGQLDFVTLSQSGVDIFLAQAGGGYRPGNSCPATSRSRASR